MTSKLSILGLWTWDNTIFDNMLVPDGVDKDTITESILSEFADLEVLYPSAPFMKTMIELWSKKELPVWERVYKATLAEYNPIENYDRHEEWTDNKSQTASNTEVTDGESRDSGTNTQRIDNDSKHYVAGYNEPSVVLQAHDIDNNTITDTPNTKREIDSTVTNNGNGKEDITHKGRVHGNIGVTTSQQMLDSELNIAPKLNIVDYIVNSFKLRFCIMVY